MGLEGMMSKRRDRPYQAGRSKHGVKVKNRTHPAMSRVDGGVAGRQFALVIPNNVPGQAPVDAHGASLVLVE